MIGSQTIHNIDVVSRSRMSKYGSNVACIIISNPLCSGSGLASDPWRPPWNWFCASTQSRRKLIQDISGKQERGVGVDRKGDSILGLLKDTFSHGKDGWLQWLSLKKTSVGKWRAPCEKLNSLISSPGWQKYLSDTDSWWKCTRIWFSPKWRTR